MKNIHLQYILQLSKQNIEVDNFRRFFILIAALKTRFPVTMIRTMTDCGIVHEDGLDDMKRLVESDGSNPVWEVVQARQQRFKQGLIMIS